jgi:hypothetical protein
MFRIASQVDSGDNLLQARFVAAKKQEVVPVSMRNSDNGSSSEKPRKLDVSSGKLGRGKPIEEIQQKLELKENELVRSHNRSFAQKGAEMLRLINLCGLGNVDSDEMIGRLLDTKAVAEANPGKIKEWTKAGEVFRLNHNPKDRPGFFSAVAFNVAADDEVLIAEVAELGFKHNDKFASYEGTIDIAAALDALRGTDVTLRVKVGGAKKGRYIVALERGQEVDGARNILLGDDGAVQEVASTRGAPKPTRYGFGMATKPQAGSGVVSSGADEANK